MLLEATAGEEIFYHGKDVFAALGAGVDAVCNTCTVQSWLIFRVCDPSDIR